MANISALIQSKAGRDEARQEERRVERDNLSAMCDAALSDVTTTPEKYQRFLTLLGDNIGCSAGNVALSMIQLPNATKIGTTAFWHEQGRYVKDEEMRSGAQMFVSSRGTKYRGYLMGSYYDIAQTTGRPLKMTAALAALMNASPVQIVEDAEMEVPAFYDDRTLTLAVNPAYSETEVFAALATEIYFAKDHDRGRNSDYDRDAYRLDAESVGYMVCRRFGVDCPMPEAENVAKLYDGYEATDRSEALDTLRKTARDMGENIERSIQPRQQERPRRQNAR